MTFVTYYMRTIPGIYEHLVVSMRFALDLLGTMACHVLTPERKSRALSSSARTLTPASAGIRNGRELTSRRQQAFVNRTKHIHKQQFLNMHFAGCKHSVLPELSSLIQR